MKQAVIRLVVEVVEAADAVRARREDALRAGDVDRLLRGRWGARGWALVLAVAVDSVPYALAVTGWLLARTG